jgi:hypothetical protein
MSMLMALLAIQCGVWLPAAASWLPSLSQTHPVLQYGWALVAAILALNAGLLEAALKVSAALTASAQQAMVDRAQTQASGAVRVVPPALAASLERVVESHRAATRSHADPGVPAPAEALGGARGSLRAGDRDMWQEVAASDEEALSRAFWEVAQQIGAKDVPLVMARGKGEEYSASLEALPYGEADMTGVWLKVRPARCCAMRCVALRCMPVCALLRASTRVRQPGAQLCTRGLLAMRGVAHQSPGRMRMLREVIAPCQQRCACRPPLESTARAHACAQDRERSDSMAEACDAAQLNGLLRRAVNLMKGLEIALTPEGFSFAVLSVIPLLKIYERCDPRPCASCSCTCTQLAVAMPVTMHRLLHPDCHRVCRYSFDGTITRFGRRDMRRGKAYGRVEPTPAGVMCVSRWDEPLPGWGKELFRLVGEGELQVEAEMHMNGRLVTYNTIYHRR